MNANFNDFQSYCLMQVKEAFIKHLPQNVFGYTWGRLQQLGKLWTEQEGVQVSSRYSRSSSHEALICWGLCLQPKNGVGDIFPTLPHKSYIKRWESEWRVSFYPKQNHKMHTHCHDGICGRLGDTMLWALRWIMFFSFILRIWQWRGEP